MLQHLGSPGINLNEEKSLAFKIVKKPETDYLELTMDLPTMLFMGGMANAIASMVLAKMLANLEPWGKKCSKCNSGNPKMSNYCLVCGTKFES
jgi:hypothetical protein